MSRLYYSPEKFEGADDDKKNVSNPSAKEYLEKVAKLIPAEIIAAYLAIIGFVPLIKKASFHEGFYWGAFIFCALLTPVYFYWQAEKDNPNLTHIILSSISFIFWAYSTTGDKIVPAYFDSAIASIAIIVFSVSTAFIPLKQ